MLRGNTFFLIFFIFSSIVTNGNNQLLPDTFNINNPEHYINQTIHYIKNGELDEAKQVVDMGLEKSKKSNDSYLLTNMTFYLADIHYYSQNYDSALELYLQVLPEFKEIQDTLMIARTYNCLGLIYSFKSNSKKKLEYYLEAHKLLLETKSTRYAILVEKSVLLTNMIGHFSNDGNYEKVLELVPDAIELTRRIDYTDNLGALLNSKAIAHKNLGDIELALATYNEASEMYLENNDNFRNSFIMNNMGSLYELDNYNLDSALFYFTKAQEGFDADSYQWGSTQAKLGIASIHAKLENYDKSISTYQSVIDTTLAYKFYDVLTMAYDGMSQTKFQQGNYKDAFNFKQLYNTLNDSLFNEEKHKQYAELETKYNISLKEKEISALEAEKLNHQLIIQKTKLRQNVAILIVVLLSVIAITISSFYRQKRKDNQKLQLNNQKIEAQNKDLKEKNESIKYLFSTLQKSRKEISIANNAKNKFFSILAHDLRNPFHNVLGQSFLLSYTYDKLSVSERKQYADEIYNSCDQVNRLLENLLEWTRTQTKGIKFQPQKTRIDELITNVLTVLGKNAKDKNINIQNNVTAPIEVVADKEMLETIVRNLVNNSIKFTPKGGNITITAEHQTNKVKLTVSDTGVGISEKNIKRLFKIDENIKTSGTNNEKGTGLGLVICKEFINFHEGSIWVDSEIDKGSSFHFEIPNDCSKT